MEDIAVASELAAPGTRRSNRRHQSRHPASRNRRTPCVTANDCFLSENGVCGVKLGPGRGCVELAFLRAACGAKSNQSDQSARSRSPMCARDLAECL
eukprot:3610629-Rhodomonas_salina.1